MKEKDIGMCGGIDLSLPWRRWPEEEKLRHPFHGKALAWKPGGI